MNDEIKKAAANNTKQHNCDATKSAHIPIHTTEIFSNKQQQPCNPRILFPLE
jgi:hypothetical protein